LLSSRLVRFGHEINWEFPTVPSTLIPAKEEEQMSIT